jgi:hypothetical protein
MDSKESLVLNNHMTSQRPNHLSGIEIDKPFDLLFQIINNRKEYGRLVFAEYIHSLLYNKSRGPIEIIEWIKNNLMIHINLIVQEMIEYIFQLELDEYSFVMFDICCQMDLEKTKHYFVPGILIYDKLLELYEVKKELENYKSKYESLDHLTHFQYIPLMYCELNDDYNKYMNQIR